ncbi:MAG TPA: TetR/AcrR family transcriptional regulator [Acidimicrobiales bacterium]
MPATAVNPAERRPGRRMARADRVEQLLDVAEVLFAEHGYDGTSIERIARTAGITRPVVYDHFGSKDGIYLACVRRARDRLETAITEGVVGVDDLERRLFAGLDACFAFIEADPARWAVMFRGVAVTGDVADEAQEQRFATVDTIADLIHAATPRAPRRQVEAFAHALSGAGQQMERWWRHNPDIPRAEVVDHLHRFAWSGLSQLVEN